MSRPELMADSFNNDPSIAIPFEVFLESIGWRTAQLSEAVFNVEESGSGDQGLIDFLNECQFQIFLIRNNFSIEDFLDEKKKKSVIDELDIIMKNVKVRLKSS